MGEAGVGAAQARGHTRHVLGKALDVNLVDDGGLPRRVRPGCNGKGRVNDNRARHVRGGIEGRAAHRILRRVQLLVHAVGVHRGPQINSAFDAPPVGVKQELVGVEELAAVGVPGAVDAEAVAGARAKSGNVAVPHARARTHQGVTCLRPLLVEDAHVHSVSVPGYHGNVKPIPGRVHADTCRGRVGRGDPHGWDAGRARTLGHRREPLPDERPTVPRRRTQSPSMIRDR